MAKCVCCGRETTALEQNLTRKLINRAADKFFCKKCLAEKFSCTEEDLDGMAEQFRKQGCMLFR